MRSGRLTALVLAGLLATVAAGCSPVPAAVEGPLPTGSASASPSLSPSPTAPPVDAAVTLDVCNQVSAASVAVTKVFKDQMAAIEQAAAHNDQASMVTAAETINTQFVTVAAAFRDLAKLAIPPELKTVLTDIATALTQMSSVAYAGTTVDILKKLNDFDLALTPICRPPASASPSPTV